MANPFMNFIDTLAGFSRDLMSIAEGADLKQVVLTELRLDHEKVESCNLLGHLKEAQIDRSALEVITKRDLEKFCSMYPIPFGLQVVFISRVQEWQKNNRKLKNRVD